MEYWEEQKQLFKGVLRKMCSENMQQIYWRTPMPKCDFNKVALQFYGNRTSAWVFSYKFATYFQSTFSQEHLWRAASVIDSWRIWIRVLLLTSFFMKIQPKRIQKHIWYWWWSYLSIEKWDAFYWFICALTTVVSSYT